MRTIWYEETLIAMIRIEIDGQAVDVERDTTILQAARQLAIDIPALCHHAAVKPYSACRICTVEVIRRGRSQLTASCSYPIREEIQVLTNSERVIHARRVLMELLLAQCPESKDIRDLAHRLGVENTRFRTRGEGSNCILCGLCVRVCRDVIGVSAISFVNRGWKREVKTPFDAPSEVCIACRACAHVCPTGAIQAEDISGNRMLSFWQTSRELQACASCGRPFAPGAEVQHLTRGRDDLRESLGICPQCRRTETGGRLERWTTSAQSRAIKDHGTP
ncbi:MAG: (2Fe-2S)-binding protein [Armatimonadetes bacterium CG_4_10_14_3_um_filter_59_10]|nr:MAG: (2Fe-2S)-binding protein [Armatimonadetes bacterium CG_4_10_14_3_um_filter_59_10]